MNPIDPFSGSSAANGPRGERRSVGREETVCRKGRGLRSIPVRFALMVAGFTTACLAVTYGVLLATGGSVSLRTLAVISLLLVAVPTLAVYFSALRLANAIRILRHNTEAILTGDTTRELDTSHSCELGGLADSFRAMVGRLNNNMLRMNMVAYTDMVTNLPNRAVVTHLLHIMQDSARAQDADWNGSAALLFLDLDGFKRINDTLGHEAGDDLLRLVAERIVRDGLGLEHEELDHGITRLGELRRTPPQQPLCARFAGDEFVVLLPGHRDDAEIEVIARRILRALLRPFVVRENELTISASLGIARAPLDSGDPLELLTMADLAMYAAKDSGKNCYHFFDRSLKQVADERAVLEAELRRGLGLGELDLHYQPQLDTRTLQLTSVEALVRWNHPERGLVAPGRFIGIAEQSGLMPELGLRVLEQAVAQARRWMDEGVAVPVAVNLSAAQFERPSLVSEILAVLDRLKVPPRLLEIEITETIAMSEHAATHYRMEQLREAGVTLSIDDFGTGLSNLSQLSRLPFDRLKIDRSLIRDIGTNSRSEAIVAGIVSMAHALGHSVVAEGIEHQVQHEFLYRAGCNRVQGHLFGSAMPASLLADWRRDALPHHNRTIGPADRGRARSG